MLKSQTKPARGTKPTDHHKASKLSQKKKPSTKQQKSAIHTRPQAKSISQHRLGGFGKRSFATEAKQAEAVPAPAATIEPTTAPTTPITHTTTPVSPTTTTTTTTTTTQSTPPITAPLLDIHGITKPTHWTRTLSETVKSARLFNSTALIVGAHENAKSLSDHDLFTHDAYLAQYLDQNAMKPEYDGPQIFAQHRNQSGASRIWNNSHADMRHFNFHDFIAMIASTTIQHPVRVVDPKTNLRHNPITYNSKWSHRIFRGISVPLRLNTGFVGPMVKRQLVHWNHTVRGPLPAPSDPQQTTDGDLADWFNATMVPEEEEAEVALPALRIKVGGDKTGSADKSTTTNTDSANKDSPTDKPQRSGFAVRGEAAKIQNPAKAQSTAPLTSGKGYLKKSNTTFTKSAPEAPAEFSAYKIPSHIEHLILTPWRHDMIRFDAEAATTVANPVQLGLETTIFITVPLAVQNAMEKYRPQLVFPDLPKRQAQELETKANQNAIMLDQFLKTKRLSTDAKAEMLQNATAAGVADQYPWLTDTDKQSITYAVTVKSTKWRFGERFEPKLNHAGDVAQIEAFISFMQNLQPLDNKQYGAGSYVSPHGDREDWTFNALTQLPPLTLLTHLVGGIDQGEAYPGHPS